MRIIKTKYKNIFALQAETENYTALVLPSEGGKIASFFDKRKGKEYLLQNPSKTFLSVRFNDDFEKGECSGFDDMFPTIDPVIVDGKEYPDHGEVCRVSFDYEMENDTLILLYRSERFGYIYQKTFSEGKNGELKIDYSIKSDLEDFKALWSAHCFLSIEEGGKLILPFDEGELVDCVDDTENPSTERRYPYEKEEFIIRFPKKKRAKKWYFPNPCKKGYVGYQTPQGDTFMMTFDEKRLPYLGIWLDYGTVNGSNCVGLEPCTLGYDTVVNAEKHGQRSLLKKEEELKFSLSLFVKR